MQIQTTSYKHCDVITVKGRVDSATAPKLSQALEAVMQQDRYKIVLDLEGVEYMSSAGFRALLAGQRACKRYNRGEIVLARVPVRVKEALELAGFTGLFRTFDDLTAAVGNF